ncbi:MAG TPA: alginate export family protein [Candidatus Wunengus sp. YC63]|uniref:alginate export family protein n=1 Tax=unclassified Candidatus Wunengus TaxID=3367695 RepID=UPI004028F843
MKNGLWKTCIGGFATAVFCVATCAQSFGADAKSIEEMEKELNALRSSVSSLTEQIESVKSEKAVASMSSDTKEDVEALRNEVTTLKEEMKTAAQAEQALKAEDIAGNVYSEFAKKVKLGGQIRTRAEYANGFYQTPSSNATLGGATRSPNQAVTPHASESADDDYVMNQTRLWADADVNEHLRVFIQLQDSRVFGAEGTTVGFASGYNADTTFDVHQGYFDIKKLFDLPLTVRVGRQEIVWGDHRVIGNFVWSNVGRVFDGGRFLWDTDSVHAEVIATKVDEDGYFGADGSNNSDENMYAAQLAFKKLVPGALLELMYIQKNDQNDTTNSATANGYAAAGDGPGVVIHDIGARIDGKLPNLDAVDYTLEAHGQFGDYGGQDQKAWAFAGRTGYTCKEVAWTPRFGVEYDFSSGDDDQTDNDHETFDNLYPTNHWQGNYGFIDLLSWQNIQDFRGNIKVAPTSKMTVQVDYHYYLLAEEEDGWYLANGSLATARPAGGFTSNDDNLAQEVDLTVSYDLYKNVKILAGYSWFGAEDWIEDNVGEIDTSWGYLQTTVTF